jgi:hypothetical protein
MRPIRPRRRPFPYGRRPAPRPPAPQSPRQPAPIPDQNGETYRPSTPIQVSREPDVAKAVAYGKRVRLYPLSQAAEPPATTFVDLVDNVYEGQATFFAKPDAYPVDARGILISYAHPCAHPECPMAEPLVPDAGTAEEHG